MEVMRTAARFVAVGAAALLVAACGGGGGGGEAEGPPSGQRETPLTITASNAQDVSYVALGYAESALTLGLAAVDWLDDLHDAQQVRIEGSCRNVNSSRLLVLVDRDGNGVLSVGDRVDVSLSNCFVPAFNWDAFSGEVSIDIAAPASNSVRWSGTVTPGPGFGIDAGADGQLVLRGALRFQASAERLGSSLRVRSAAAPLTVQFSAQGVSFTDVLTQIDAVKAVRRDTARATASFTLRVASDLLGGAIAATTETPFRAWFDTFPDQGVVRVSGAGTSLLRVSAVGSTSQRLAVSLDAAALGTIVALESLDGYLWSGTGIVPQDPSFFPYVILTELPQPFKVISGPDGSPIAPTAALAWQLSRPVAPDTPTAAEFRASGTTLGWPTVPATATVEGSLYTIVPSGALEPGVTYSLVLLGQVSDGVRSENGAYVPLPTEYTVAAGGGN
jgi:hypothetical protein